MVDMVHIYIDTTGNNIQWLYESDKWKDYVCEDFDEHVVIFRSKNRKVIEKAKWYKEAREILESIENGGSIPEGFDCDCIESFDEEGKNLINILHFLYPDRNYKYYEITHGDELDWIECIVDDVVDPCRLTEIYYKKIVDIEIHISEFKNGFHKRKDIITYSEFANAEKMGIKEYFIKKYELSSDTKICVMRADEYMSVPNWYDVC